MLSKGKLESLRLQYEKVREVKYTIGNKEHSVVVRKPKFDEYVYFNKHSVNYAKTPNDEPVYELDPDVTDIFFSWIVVYPENIDISKVPPGKVLEACVSAVGLCDYEDPDKLKDMYISAIKNSQTIIGAIVERLVMTFGIQAYSMLKYLSEEEVTELLVISELAQNELGAFGKLANIPLPFDRRGKLNLHALLGIPEEDGKKGSISSQIEERARNRTREYYRKSGLSEDQIDKIMEERERAEAARPAGPVDELLGRDEKVDINKMSEEQLSQVPYDQYMKLKKDGKIKSYDESVQDSIAEAQDSLAKKIATDKAKFGDKFTQRNFKGDLRQLLKSVKLETRDME